MNLDPKTERSLAMLLHLSGFLNGVFPIVIPLVIWLLKKDSSNFIKEHGKTALNFQLSVLILGAVASLFVVFTIGIGALIIIPLAFIFGLLYIMMILTATIKAYQGELYEYPWCWKFF